MLAIISVSAQTDFAQQVQRKLSDYYENEAGPKSVITFNQPEYYPGDTVFFKTYLLTSAGNAFMKGWQVIDIFVTDENNTIKLRNRTSIKNGTGASQFRIPANAKAGVYNIVVAQPDQTKASKHPVALRTSFVVSGKKLQKSSTAGIFAAHPEGGKLVANVSNFLIVTGLTYGDTALLESSGSQHMKIAIQEDGVGRFSFIPQSNQNYFLRHKDRRIVIGPVTETGVAIVVTPRKETNTVDLALYKNNGNKAYALHLVCINKNKLVDAFPLRFEMDGRAVITLSLNLLPAGVNRFLVVDENGNAYAERLYYKTQAALFTSVDSEVYSTRDTIDFEIALPEELSSRSIHGSISVFKRDLFPNHNQGSSFQQITFTDATTEFPLSPALPEQLINDLLITATPTIPWTDIWSASARPQQPDFSPFFKGTIVLPDGAPVKDSTLITFWFKSHDFIYQVHAPSHGRFSFPLFNEFGDDEILYTVTYKKNYLSDARVILDSVTLPTHVTKPASYTDKENPYTWFTSLRSAIQKSYGYFQNDDNDVIIRPYVESIPTDATFPIEKFKDFASVAEMVNEVIPVAKARKVGARYELRVFLREYAMHASDNPLIMIDGVVTDSVDYLMNMNPREIKSLGVVNSRNKLVRYGALGRNGIITVETNRTEIQDLRSRRSIFVKGVDRSTEFSMPIFRVEDRTPFLRSTLLWDPHVTLTKASSYTAQFKASDDVGEYVIWFSGIDEKGTSVQIMKTFEVKYNAE